MAHTTGTDAQISAADGIPASQTLRDEVFCCMNRKSALLCALVFVWMNAGGAASAQITIREDRHASGSNLSREKDALYVEDILPKPMRLKVTKEAVVYNTLTGERRLGVIPAGRIVSVVALHEKAIRVRGRAEHDDVSGWVAKASLQEIDPQVMDRITRMVERHRQVEELIRNREVALGMTPEEVERVLGKPTRTSSKLDKTGQSVVYEYVMYRSVPQRTAMRDQFGRIFYTTTYVKMETGRRTVAFENGTAASIEESTDHSGPYKVVPMPVEIDLLRQ